jgi:uncharacterized protein (TIGR03435 family)
MLATGFLLAVSNSLAASIVAKATVTAALGLIGVWLTRRSRAAVRHALLAAAFGVLLVLPIASLVAPPVGIAIAARERIAPSPGDTGTISPIAPSQASATVAPVHPKSAGLSLSTLLFAAWLAGMALFLFPVTLGLWHVRSLRRTAVPWRHGQQLVDWLAAEGLVNDAGIDRVEVLLSGTLPGPMTCGIFHPAIVLPQEAETWQQEDLNRAIVHELEHVRRGDWASQSLARVVCAAYWFHPLVWIAWRRLSLEAERSCDDAVLLLSEATAYADQLVGLARRLSTAKRTPVPAMANRADLATRVSAVLDSGQQRGRAGKFPVAFACVVAAVLVLFLSPLKIVAAPQSASAPSSAIKFDAVSVKLIDPNMQGEHSHEKSDPGHITITGTMHWFILRTYGITEGQLGGEPDWFAKRLYTIEAVTSVPATPDRMMLMLRAALADRFQLKLRQEDREMPVFALEVGAGGPKLRELKPGEVQRRQAEPNDADRRLFSDTSLKELINSLNGVFGGILKLERPIVDRTQLTGKYDIQFQTAVELQTDDFGRRTQQLPDLSRDMQSQLGLRLVPERVKMPYFVVEQAAAPSPN